MNAPPEEGAWLEAADGRRHPIKGSCSLGRAGANTIVLESPKVSRRHALIHLQNIGELWLIDFGSSNGTFLNKRRIHHPIRLSDRDQITIGDQVFKVPPAARHFRAGTKRIGQRAIKSQSEIRFSRSGSQSPFRRSTKRT